MIINVRAHVGSWLRTTNKPYNVHTLLGNSIHVAFFSKQIPSHAQNHAIANLAPQGALATMGKSQDCGLRHRCYYACVCWCVRFHNIMTAPTNCKQDEMTKQLGSSADPNTTVAHLHTNPRHQRVINIYACAQGTAYTPTKS